MNVPNQLPIQPLVSIVIPTYNAAEFLNESIDSVLNQDYPHIELIVLDDGSTDETQKVLKSYPKGSFYWDSHPNMGQSATLNKGWEIAKGSVLSYLSADDILLPNAVKISVENLRKRNDVVMTYCDYMLMDSGSQDIRRVVAPDFSYEKLVSEIIVQPGPGIFFLKSSFDRIGGWNPKLKQVPDFEYWLRLGLEGEFQRIPEVLAKFRVHENSQTFSESSIEKSEECVQVMNEYYCSQVIPHKIRLLEKFAKSNAHLYVARLHLRAGRYKAMLKNIWKAGSSSPKAVFSFRTIRLLGSGILFRMKRLLS